jgi:hypothetical protein
MNNHIRVFLKPEEWNSLSIQVRTFICLYGAYRGRNSPYTPNLGELLELHQLVNRSGHQEVAPSRIEYIYNHGIEGNEFSIYYEGELIEVVLYEVEKGIQNALARFNR